MAACFRALALLTPLRPLAYQCIHVTRRDSVTLHGKLSSVGNFSGLGLHLSFCRSSSTLQHQALGEDGPPDSRGRLSETPEEILQSLSPEMEKKLKVIKLEYDVMLHMSECVANKMTPGMWVKLLECETKSARRRLHKYFRSCERHDFVKERKKAERRKLREEREKLFESGELQKAELNTIVLKIRKRTILKYHNSKLAHAMMFGFPLIIDLDFEESMRSRDLVNLAEQIMTGHGFNKLHKEPFHMIFCNARKGSQTLRAMQAQSAYLPLEKYMFTVTDQSYLDLFPRDKLVYLTPHASEVMRNYDHDKVYIVGGIVDKYKPKPLTLAKAKREGIAMAKLPLDYFYKWEKGTKSLTIDQMVRIMLDIQMTQDWQTAFRHIPTRKVITEEQTEGHIY